jgi:NAD(P)H-dependent FMN reductase
MEKIKILVVLGSIREGRQGEKVANWYLDTVKNVEGAEFELLDLKNHSLPLFTDAVSGAYREGKHPNADVQAFLDKIAGARGIVILAAEYNHSVPGALKNALDYTYWEWKGKPVGFVGYGGAAGGARSVEHLRQIIGELRAYDVRDQVVLPFVWTLFDESGKMMNGEPYEHTALAMTNDVLELARKLA